MSKYIQCKCAELGELDVSLQGLQTRIEASMEFDRFYSVLTTIESPKQMALRQCRVCKKSYQESPCGQGFNRLHYFYEISPVEREEWKEKPFPDPFSEIVDSKAARKAGL